MLLCVIFFHYLITSLATISMSDICATGEPSVGPPGAADAAVRARRAAGQRIVAPRALQPPHSSAGSQPTPSIAL